MRITPVILAVLVLGLGMVSNAPGGVYQPSEPLIWPVPADNYPRFRSILSDLQSLRIPAQDRPVDPQSLRARCFNQVALLEAGQRAGTLTVSDRVDLGAWYIREGKAEKAVQVLEAVPREQRNFMVLANLATAHHMADRLDRAVHYQQQVLREWPGTVVGWSPEQLRWFAWVEKHYLRMLQARHQELVRRAGKPWDTLDPIFPAVRFVGPGGQYEAGTLAPEFRDELPPDAIHVVVQLLLWLPNDDRLYWLLGELLNARGNVLLAERIMDELVYARGNTRVRELQEHRRALVQVKESAAELARPTTQALLLWVAAPRGMMQAPVAGPLAYECVWDAFHYYQPYLSELEGARATTPAAEAQPTASPPPSWLPNWRHIGVGFVAGAAVALLAQMQWRESRRRRQALASSDR
jgi:hypothetical protein